MDSKQNNIKADIEKQPFPSTKSLKIFVDKVIDENENEHGQPSHRPNKSANGNVLTNASNKFEAQEKEHQDQQQGQLQMKKKKKWKKYRSKKHDSRYSDADENYYQSNRNINNARRTNQHQDNHEHRDHHLRRNNQGDYVPHEGNRSDSTQVQYPIFVPGNRGTLNHFHPQQSKYPDADDGNGRVLASRQYPVGDFNQDYGSYALSSNGSTNNTKERNDLKKTSNRSSLGWMDLINENSQIQRLYITNSGKSKNVAVPENVGAALVQVLMMQKKSVEASSNYQYKYYENYPPTDNPNVHSHISHQPNEQFDRQVNGGNFTQVSNPPQLYNSYGALPPHYNNYGVPMHSPIVNPMVQQDFQYPPMHQIQYTGMPSFVANAQSYGWAVPGYIHTNEYHTEERTGVVHNEVIEGDNHTEKEGYGHPNHLRNRTIDSGSTPNRADIHQAAVVEGGNHPQVHEHNRDALTPHRGNIGRNDENPTRRVSFSPMVPLVHTSNTVVDVQL